MVTPSTRHIACNICRDRKVRCDGARPCCARCSDFGAHCVYKLPVKQEIPHSLKDFMEDLFLAIPRNLEHQMKDTHTDEETSQQVFTSKNEAQSGAPDDTQMMCSSNETCSDSSTFSSAEDSSSMGSSISDYSHLNTSSSCEALTSLDELSTSQTCMDSLVYQGFDQSFLQTAPSPSLLVDFEELDSQNLNIMNQGHEDDMPLDMELFQFDQAETALTTSISSLKLNDIQPEVLDDLCQCYFATVYRSFPMMDQEKFYSKAEVNGSNDVMALQWAMSAHVAGLCPRFLAYVQNSGCDSDWDWCTWFYSKARLHVENAGHLSESASITTLQTMILLAFYEIRNAYFSRAWATISRSTWLTHVLQLPQLLDYQYTSIDSMNICISQEHFLINDDNGEARRTLWALSALDCFIGIGVSWNMASASEHSELATYILREDALNCPEAASLRPGDALRYLPAWPLSNSQGMIVATALCSHSITHLKRMCRGSPLTQRDYNFWARHYRLDGNVGYLTAYIQNDIDSTICSDDDTKLMLDLMLKAISTCLHQAVLATTRTMEVSRSGQTQASAALSLESAIDIARLFQSKDLTAATEANLFLPWTVYVALQALIRQLHASNGGDELSPISSTPPYQAQATFSHATPFPLAPQEQHRLDSTVSNSTWTDVVARDSITTLRCVLHDLHCKNSLAAVFYDQIEQEMVSSAQQLHARPVGLVDFMATYPRS